MSCMQACVKLNPRILYSIVVVFAVKCYEWCYSGTIDGFLGEWVLSV